MWAVCVCAWVLFVPYIQFYLLAEVMQLICDKVA